MSKNLIKGVSWWIESHYSASLMLALFLVVFGFFWLFNFSPLPFSNSEFVKLSGHEGLLDAMPFYSAQEAYTTLTHYGVAGRKLYLRFLATDFVFIPFYCLSFAFLMTQIIRAVCGPGTSWLMLNSLPFGVAFFDCAENICILGMLGLYPGSNTILGTISGVTTLCKWLLTLATASCLVYGGFVLLVRRLGFKHS
ncbi:MAG: hypothetical protein HQK56_14560 [Deltaproteobacteria bacterium]|nr:hypothetical protein [Deltaproteobacteria bacterium]